MSKTIAAGMRRQNRQELTKFFAEIVQPVARIPGWDS
jgi:hypothetical protein